MFVTWNQSQQIWKHLKKVFTAPRQELIDSTGGDIGEPEETPVSSLCQRSERKD